MIDNTFSNNLKEVYVVLEKLNIVEKLPSKFVQFIIENKNDEYDFEYLTVIYQDFLCTKGQRIEFDKILMQNEKREQEELSEKYSYEKLFPNQKEKYQKQMVQESTQLIEFKENILKKFIKKIKSIFSKII